MVREAHKMLFSSVVKGWFHDSRTNVIDDMCWGDWMETKPHYMTEVAHKVRKGDIWNLTEQDFRNASDSLWENIFKNFEYCGIYRFAYDNYSWCMDNIETCVYHTGMADRVMDNAIGLAMNAFEVVSTVRQMDHHCDPEEKILSDIGLVIEKVVGNMSTIKGFKGNWDPKSSYEKLSFHEMHMNIRDLKHATKRPHQECPIKTLMKRVTGDEHPFETIHQYAKQFEHTFHPHFPTISFPSRHHEKRESYKRTETITWGGYAMPHLF